MYTRKNEYLKIFCDLILIIELFTCYSPTQINIVIEIAIETSNNWSKHWHCKELHASVILRFDSISKSSY